MFPRASGGRRLFDVSRIRPQRYYLPGETVAGDSCEMAGRSCAGLDSPRSVRVAGAMPPGEDVPPDDGLVRLAATSPRMPIRGIMSVDPFDIRQPPALVQQWPSWLLKMRQ